MSTNAIGEAVDGLIGFIFWAIVIIVLLVGILVGIIFYLVLHKPAQKDSGPKAAISQIVLVTEVT